MLGEDRSPYLPDVPTTGELGYPVNLPISAWWMAPKGTPKERIKVLADALEKAMKRDSVKKAFESRGIAPTFLRGAALKAAIDENSNMIRSTAKKFKIKKKK
jgi:tripartite-type tricarboxylate transporter receptor subunit TctC